MHPLPRPRDPLPGTGHQPASTTPPRSGRARLAAPVLVREAVAADVPSTARLHIEHLPVGLFPRLGHRFVACWHSAHLDSPHAVALVVDGPSPDGGRCIAGFLIGALDRHAFQQELLSRYRTRLVVRGAGALALRPRVLVDFLRTRLRPYLRHLRTPRPTPSVPPGAVALAPVAELTAVAMAPALRRTGSGRRLVDEFVDRCAAADVRRIELVTDVGSAGSVDFYRRTGWTALRRIDTRDGRTVQRFVRWTEAPKES
ncbi:GNAT family N-acetyltransferase [Pseudonocardia sp. KRD-182]|uniref:GNAT family N-acetyltransferase n=1 Tax=Pseudonocardia oceani TaxID=2792013 RepID=UPI001C4A750C|nr:GNAT family N-acetyltransferase [Pseudonocardia oceani]MBW0108823.1 GNAT family N-acetyltransferase [Pseudonocardia oceani]